MPPRVSCRLVAAPITLALRCQKLIAFASFFTGYIWTPQENPLLSAGVSPCGAPKGGLKALRAFLYPRSVVSDKPDLLDYIPIYPLS